MRTIGEHNGRFQRNRFSIVRRHIRKKLVEIDPSLTRMHDGAGDTPHTRGSQATVVADMNMCDPRFPDIACEKALRFTNKVAMSGVKRKSGMRISLGNMQNGAFFTEWMTWNLLNKGFTSKRLDSLLSEDYEEDDFEE